MEGRCFHIDDLPNEIIDWIIDFLDPKQVFSTINRVCKRWQGLIEAKSVVYFERLLRNEFGSKKVAELKQTRPGIVSDLKRFFGENKAFRHEGLTLTNAPQMPCCGGFLAAFNSPQPYFTKHGRHQWWLNLQTLLPEPFSVITMVLNIPFEFTEVPGIMFCLHSGTLRFEQLSKQQMNGQSIQCEYDSSVRFIAILRYCSDYNCEGPLRDEDFDETLTFRFVLPSFLDEKSAHRIRYWP